MHCRCLCTRIRPWRFLCTLQAESVFPALYCGEFFALSQSVRVRSSSRPPNRTLPVRSCVLGDRRLSGAPKKPASADKEDCRGHGAYFKKYRLTIEPFIRNVSSELFGQISDVVLWRLFSVRRLECPASVNLSSPRSCDDPGAVDVRSKHSLVYLFERRIVRSN